MIGRIEFDPVPVPFAGVVTTSCECGWEIVSIIPEENDQRLLLIISHLINFHGLIMPKMFTFNH